MPWFPHKTVSTVIERDGRFLMVEEVVDGRTVFNQPAGHLEPGESLAEAAVRETLEETGWEVELEAVLGVYQNTSTSSGTCYIRTCYIARPLRHWPDRPLDSGIVRACWMSRSDLLKHQDALRGPVVLTVVDDYLSGQRFALDAVKLVES